MELGGREMTVFKIIFLPRRCDDRLHLEKRGATLLFNGEVFDPSIYDESLPYSQWIDSRPETIEDGWSVTVVLPHGWPAPRATRFPSPIVVSADGPVELPAYEGPDEDEAELRLAVAAKLAAQGKGETTVDGQKILIPKCLSLGEMPEGVYFSETTSPFHEFPEFGAAVAHVIGTVSLIDLEMRRLMISQHGSQALLAIRTVDKLLKNKDSRKKYVSSFAKNTGRDLVWKTFNWAYEFSEPILAIRNKFAHDIWGECPAIPDALLLVDPIHRLTGQAAFSQLLSHRLADEEMQVLIRIAAGEGGSKLSEADAKAIFAMAMARQSSPSRTEALNMTFGNPLDFRAPAAEVWTANDFRNAALAADMARIHVVGRLQKTTQWLNGLLSEDELEPLPEKPSRNRK